MHATLCVTLAETVQQLCRTGVCSVEQSLTCDVPNIFFRLSEVQHQRAFTGTLQQTLTTPCLSVSRLSLWNVYDSGAVDKMEIDLYWKANKIAKAQSQLKSRQREQRGEEKESKRRKCINTGLALREQCNEYFLYTHRILGREYGHTITTSWLVPRVWACMCLFDPFARLLPCLRLAALDYWHYPCSVMCLKGWAHLMMLSKNSRYIEGICWQI